MTITICSSVQFSPQIIVTKAALEQCGHVVNIPYITEQIQRGSITIADYLARRRDEGGDLSIRSEHPVDAILRYWELISASDAILVLNLTKNGIDGYIGGNTLMEMGFAYGYRKKIFLLNSVPARSERMHYVDEIVSMGPVIIDGDLARIK
jgi:hypothetical protein